MATPVAVPRLAPFISILKIDEWRPLHGKLMFEMYAEPETSFGDITRYFVEQGIDFDGRELQRPTLSYLLRNPIYAQADLELYEFLKTNAQTL